MAVFLSAAQAQALSSPVWLDCRFRLDDPAAGRRLYETAHVPGAIYAHLDEDLADLSAGPGRHPLPNPAAFHARLDHWGVSGRPLIVYDDVSGAMAARAWWLARWAGHREVYILNGGYAAWQAAGFEVSAASNPPTPAAGSWTSDQLPQAQEAQVRRGLANGAAAVVDARASARFLGHVEPIDPVAGHIPGAQNVPFEANLDSSGYLRPTSELRSLWRDAMREFAPTDVIHMCGSGVTACFNLAVLEHLELCGSRLFVASWSGWIADPNNPVEAEDAG